MFIKIISLIRKYSYNILNAFTIHNTLLKVRTIHNYPTSKRIPFMIAIILYLIYFNYTYFGLIKYSLTKTHKSDFSVNRNSLLYFFYIEVMKCDRMITIGTTFFMLHCLNIFYYGLADFMKYYEYEIHDMLRFMNFHIRHHFTIVDCIFSAYKTKHINKAMILFSNKIILNINPYVNFKDMIKILKFYKIIEAMFLTGVFLPFVGSIFIISIFLYLFFFEFSKDIPYILYPHIALTIFFNSFSLIYGIWCAWIYTTFTCTIVRFSQITWQRYSKYLQSITIQNYIKNYKFRTKVIMFQLLYSRKLYVHCFKAISKENRLMCCKAFSYSVDITMMGNIIFVTELLVAKLTLPLYFFLILILIFQMLVIFFTLIHLIHTTDRLYKPANCYVKFYSRIIRFRSRNVWWMLRLSNFIEIILPKKKFAFRLSPIGRITKRSIFMFIPAYSTVMMFILPYVIGREKVYIVQ